MVVQNFGHVFLVQGAVHMGQNMLSIKNIESKKPDLYSINSKVEGPIRDRITLLADIR